MCLPFRLDHRGQIPEQATTQRQGGCRSGTPCTHCRRLAEQANADIHRWPNASARAKDRASDRRIDAEQQSSA